MASSVFTDPTTPLSNNDEEQIIIRRMQPSDIPVMARIAAVENLESDLNILINPRRYQYPDDYTRGFLHLIQGRYYNGQSIGFVAVSSLQPQVPVAYAQFARLGNNEAARRHTAPQRSLWWTVQGWYMAICEWIATTLWPDRSLDFEALGKMIAAGNIDRKTYWDAPGMKEKYGDRWHAESVVVSSAYRRRGIGRRLMNEVLQLAEEDGVVVGLGATEDGEKLYRSLGFELRGRFSMILNRRPVGGIMMWTPKKLQ